MEAMNWVIEKRMKGELSDFSAALLVQKRAEQLGLPLAKYLETPEGHATNQELARIERLQKEFETANGDSYGAVTKKPKMASTKETAVVDDQCTDDVADKEAAKRGKVRLANPASRQRPQPEPEQMEGQEDAKEPRPILAKVAKIMKRENVSFDVAISRLHRMEKRARGFSPAAM